MTALWTLRLPLEHVSSLSRLWHVPGLSVCADGSDVWVRGDSFSDKFEVTLRGIANGTFFWIDADEKQLRERDARVPSATLPRGDWQPLAKWLQPERPASIWPGELAEPVPRVELRLVPSDEMSEPNVLLTPRTIWSEYAVTAPQVRLDRWRFALAADGRAVSRGTPLPPLVGERFVERTGIVVAAGWTWSPLVDAAVVRDLFGLGTDDILLWSCEVCEIVRSEQFVAASRSSVRSSEEEVG